MGQAPGSTYKARKGTYKARVAGLQGEIGFQFRRFEESLTDLFDALGENPEIFIKLFEGLVGQLLFNIVESTPVDTGQARASWRINLQSDNQYEVAWRITNGVPYIVFLEYGSSKQAPKGMVRINIAKFNDDTKRLVKRLLKSGRFKKA